MQSKSLEMVSLRNSSKKLASLTFRQPLASREESS